MHVSEGTEPAPPGVVREVMPARKIQQPPEVHPVEQEKRRKADEKVQSSSTNDVSVTKEQAQEIERKLELYRQYLIDEIKRKQQ